MRVDLGAECTKLRFSRQLADLLLAEFTVVTLIRNPDRVDATRDDDGNRFQGGDVVRQQTTASGQLADDRRECGWSVVGKVTHVAAGPGRGSPAGDPTIPSASLPL